MEIVSFVTVHFTTEYFLSCTKDLLSRRILKTSLDICLKPDCLVSSGLEIHISRLCFVAQYLAR